MALRPLAGVFAVGRVQFAARTQERGRSFRSTPLLFPHNEGNSHFLAKRRRLEGAQGDKKVYD
jgi:hypothetical protein